MDLGALFAQKLSEAKAKKTVSFEVQSEKPKSNNLANMLPKQQLDQNSEPI